MLHHTLTVVLRAAVPAAQTGPPAMRGCTDQTRPRTYGPRTRLVFGPRLDSVSTPVRITSRQSTKGKPPKWPIGPLLVDESKTSRTASISSRSTVYWTEAEAGRPRPVSRLTEPRTGRPEARSVPVLASAMPRLGRVLLVLASALPRLGLVVYISASPRLCLGSASIYLFTSYLGTCTR